MVNLASKLNQTITYWAPSTPDQYGGRTYAAPVTFVGRWEDRAETLTSPSGEEFISRSRVFSDAAKAINGYLYLGTSATADPRTVDGAYEIQQTGRMPNLKANQNLYTAFL
jgi:hypothetical protein